MRGNGSSRPNGYAANVNLTSSVGPAATASNRPFHSHQLPHSSEILPAKPQRPQNQSSATFRRCLSATTSVRKDVTYGQTGTGTRTIRVVIDHAPGCTLERS